MVSSRVIFRSLVRNGFEFEFLLGRNVPKTPSRTDSAAILKSRRGAFIKSSLGRGLSRLETSRSKFDSEGVDKNDRSGKVLSHRGCRTGQSR